MGNIFVEGVLLPVENVYDYVINVFFFFNFKHNDKIMVLQYLIIFLYICKNNSIIFITTRKNDF